MINKLNNQMRNDPKKKMSKYINIYNDGEIE